MAAPIAARRGVGVALTRPRGNSSLSVVADRIRPDVPPSFERGARRRASRDDPRRSVVTRSPRPRASRRSAVALAGDVRPARHGVDSELGTGRFILLYDPEEPEAWGGAFRIVCFAQAPLETDIGIDPFLADVAWSWLVDALDARGAHYARRIRHRDQDPLDRIRRARRPGRRRPDRTARLVDAARARRHRARRSMGELVCMLAGLPPGSEEWLSPVRSARDAEATADVTLTDTPSSTSSRPRRLPRRRRGASPPAPARSRSTPSARPASATRSAPTSSRSSAAAPASSSSTRRPIGGLRRARTTAIGDEEWVLHAASQDLACLREVGLDPRRIFDTELGARCSASPASGSAPSSRNCSASTSPRSTRPPTGRPGRSPSRWLDYAALDVELLVDLRDASARCSTSRQDRVSPPRSSQAVLDREPKPSRAEPWRRLCGLHTLRGQRNLAVARELWTGARGLRPRASTSPPAGWCRTRSLVAAARALPEDQAGARRIKEFTGRASRSELDRWWAAIEAGARPTDLPATCAPAATRSRRPRVGPDRNPEADARLKAARAAVDRDRRGARHPAREPAHPRPAAPRRLVSAGADRRGIRRRGARGARRAAVAD